MPGRDTLDLLFIQKITCTYHGKNRGLGEHRSLSVLIDVIFIKPKINIVVDVVADHDKGVAEGIVTEVPGIRLQ